MRRFRHASILDVDLLVEVGHRARAHTGAPQRFGDIFYPPHRNPRQIHLDQRFLDRTLAPAVAFDDRRLKGLATQLRDLQIDVARLGLQRPFIAARSCILPSFAALVATGAAQLVGFGIQQSVQRLLDGAADHLSQMIPNPRLVDLDHLAHRLHTILIIHRLLPHSRRSRHS